MDELRLRIVLGSLCELGCIAVRWVRECDWDQGMDQAEFQDWLSAAGRLTSAQRAEAADALSIDANEKRSAEGSGAAVYIWVHRNKGTWRDMRSALQSAGRLRGSNLAIRSSAVFPLPPRNRDRCVRGSVETRGALMRTTVHKSSGGQFAKGTHRGFPWSQRSKPTSCRAMYLCCDGTVVTRRRAGRCGSGAFPEEQSNGCDSSGDG